MKLWISKYKLCTESLYLRPSCSISVYYYLIIASLTLVAVFRNEVTR